MSPFHAGVVLGVGIQTAQGAIPSAEAVSRFHFGAVVVSPFQTGTVEGCG